MRNKTTMEGFYLWFCIRARQPHRRIFKFALGRMARLDPEANPREVLLETLAELLYEYESATKACREGKMNARTERLLTLIEALQARSRELQSAGPNPEAVRKKAEREAAEAALGLRLSRQINSLSRVFGTGWDKEECD